MAKIGIECFLLDCHTNDKLAEIEAEFGISGFGILVRLWQKIYAERGYYCEWNNRSALLFSARWLGGNSGVAINLINEIVQRAVSIGIFNKEMYDKYGILTSERIQKQYFDVVKRRKEIEAVSDYLLISIANFTENANFINKKTENVCKNAKNVDIFSTSKVKESKAKQSKGKEIYTAALSEITTEWNKLKDCGINTITEITKDSERYKNIIAILKKYDKDTVIQAINKIKESSFLQGHNDKSWVITFDWFVNHNNFIKVIEDNYANRNKQKENISNATNLRNIFNNYKQKIYSEDEIAEILKRKSNT